MLTASENEVTRRIFTAIPENPDLGWGLRKCEAFLRVYES
jgi:hypothetical protein